jgi:hypothetical protein
LKGRKKMTLNEYIVHLKALADKGFGDKEVVYAADEEGNSFAKVFYGPSLGVFNDNGYGHGDFDGESEEAINAVCIN